MSNAEEAAIIAQPASAPIDVEAAAPKVVPCHLWTLNQCSYGIHCKFSHTGPGGCCLSDHEGTARSQQLLPVVVPKCEKDCVAWKSKGKCNKKEKGKCLYRHDEAVRLLALERKRQKMIQHQKNSATQQQQLQNPKKPKRLKKSSSTSDDTRRLLGICLADGQAEPKILCTGGLRHVEPYWIVSSLPLVKHVGITIQEALDAMTVTHTRSKRPPLDFWKQQLDKGTLVLHEHNNNHNGYKIVAKANHVIEKSNVLRGRFHFHEESIRYNAGDTQASMIVYQDDEYLIVNKPAGVDVQTNPNAGRVFNSLPGLLYTEFGIAACYPAHRIDNNVSGLVCCGKTTTAQKRLSRRIKFGEAQKTYLARVNLASLTDLLDTLPAVVEAPLEIDSETCLTVVVVEGDDENEGKKCKTTVLSCQRRGDGTAVLQVQPNTGRKHQLRVHLQHVGLCIANDERYGGRVDEKDRLSAFWGNETLPLSPQDQAVGPTPKLPFEELLASSFAEGCSFCTFGKNLFESDSNGGDKILGPSASSGIWLHSWRYEFPTLDLSFEAPVPEWAKSEDSAFEPFANKRGEKVPIN